MLTPNNHTTPIINNIVLEFLNAESWNESKKIAQAHPELLEDKDGVNAVIQQLLEANLDDPEVVQLLVEHRELLENCRSMGIEVAFAALSGIRTFTVISFVEWLKPLAFIALGLFLIVGCISLLGKGFGWLSIIYATIIILLIGGLIAVVLWNRIWSHGFMGMVTYEVQILLLQAAVLEVAGDWGWFHIPRNDQRRIELLTRALHVTRSNKNLMASISIELGNALRVTQANDRTHNLDQAIDYYMQALEVFQENPQSCDWAITHLNLAKTYHQRSSLGSQSEQSQDLLKSVEHYSQAFTVLDDSALRAEFTNMQLDLAELWIELSHYQFPTSSTGQEYIERAHRLCDGALKTADWRLSRPKIWARAQKMLGSVWREQYKFNYPDGLKEALRCYEHARNIYANHKWLEEQAGVNELLAAVHWEIYQAEFRPYNLSKAIYHIQSSLDYYIQDNLLRGCLRAVSSLARVYFEIKHWSTAEHFYKAALEYAEEVFAAAYTEAGRRVEVGNINRLYAQRAYCLLHLRRPTEALVTLELGKTRLMNEAMALSGAESAKLTLTNRIMLEQSRRKVHDMEDKIRAASSISGKRASQASVTLLRQSRTELNSIVARIRQDQPGFMPLGIALPNILALIPEGGALVTPVITSQGSAVFVVPSGAKTISDEHIVWLEQFTEDASKALLRGEEGSPGWLRIYLDTIGDGAKWRTAIEHISGKVWDLLMAPIYSRLNELGVTRMIMMPTGGLQLLPLHAAWRVVNNKKRYLVDDFEISFVPSAYALQLSRQHANVDPGQIAVVAGISKYDNLSTLHFTKVEVEWVSALLRSTPHLDEDVTLEFLTQSTHVAGYLHLSCHGSFAWGQTPLDSALFLSHEKALTLSDIISRLELKSMRLVVLSACETGITDVRRSPDEYIGLPAGFMQAGATGVVSSLWSVNDLSTALLMAKFYTYLFKETLPPTAALRKAQLWLREVTNAELGELFDFYRQHAVDRPFTRLTHELAQVKYREYTLAERDKKPFTNPYYWAPFVFYGV